MHKTDVRGDDGICPTWRLPVISYSYRYSVLYRNGPGIRIVSLKTVNLYHAKQILFSVYLYRNLFTSATSVGNASYIESARNTKYVLSIQPVCMSIDVTSRDIPISLLRAKQICVPEKKDGVVSLVIPTDEELLEGIGNNNEGAALSLFRRYSKLAFSIGYRVLKDEGEAEDLTQEIFLRLCAEAGTFDGAKGSARTWIIQMLYRRAFDRRDYLNRRHFYSGTDFAGQTNTVMEEKSPEDAMIERLTAHQLKLAFSELSDRQRETLEAFFFEGLTLAEIAARSGQDVKNVRHHYYRGLERLRQLVRQMMRDRKIGQ